MLEKQQDFLQALSANRWHEKGKSVNNVLCENWKIIMLWEVKFRNKITNLNILFQQSIFQNQSLNLFQRIKRSYARLDTIYRWNWLKRSHSSFRYIFCIANDIWNAIGVNVDLPIFYPLIDNLSRTFPFLCKLIELWKLMLKSLDVITLISHFRFTFMEISLQRVFVCHLIFHVDLSSSPLTARFEDVNASSLDCYTNKLVK